MEGLSVRTTRGYIHHDGSIGVLVEFDVGSDFTTRTDEFKKFADRICMSLAVFLREIPDMKEPTPIESIGEVPLMDDDSTIADALTVAKAEFRETILITRWRYIGNPSIGFRESHEVA